ncbi:MAG TPA: radical SAM protein [Ignavibacteriaceae bacterium]|nr:radical SAM protein [Ignavibacteriaceae bacterium]
MKKKIYIIQPTYRLMDGKLIKELPLFNYSYNLPIISATIPEDWQKETCLEYTEEVDFDTDASVIVITSPGYDVARSVEIIETFKEKNKIVIFGAHMDKFSDKILRNVCDAVFYGYPNPAKMKELLTDIESGTLKTEYHFGNNLNFPFDYSILQKRKMPFIPMIASLGCRYKCAYCCYPPIFEGHYQLRNVEHVISDLKDVAKMKKPIAFLDANLYNNRKYLVQLCNRIIEEKIHIKWGAQCTVNIGDDIEVLNLLHEAGCRMIFLGLETLDNKNMIQLNKEMNADYYSRQITNIRNTGIQIGAFFMLGLDEDDSSTFDKVYSFFQENKIAVPYVHIYFPIPGTSLAEKLRADGRILEDYFDDYQYKQSKFSAPCSVAYFSPAKLTKPELEAGFLRLFEKITSLKNIFRRIFVPDLRIALLILKMNLEARRKSKSMKRNALRSGLETVA